jgi:hypothetical protein
MDKKTIFILAIFIATIFFLIIFFISFKKHKINSSPLEQGQATLETCKILQYNGEDKVDILFFSDEKTAETYKDFFLTISPFKENPNYFNFFYIDNYVPECELYKGVAILCYSRELIRKAASCPNDFIVVIKEEDKEIRSSSFMNTLSINKALPLTVFPHEFAHAFAILADEYVAHSPPPRKSKNCPHSCENFEGLEDDCFDGCSETSRKRSIQEGLMRTLSTVNPRFGTFDESLILKVMNSLSTPTITGGVINAEEREYNLIEIIKEDGKFVVVSKTSETGYAGGNGNGASFYTVINEDGQEAMQGSFNAEAIFIDGINEESHIVGGRYDNVDSFYLTVPAEVTSEVLVNDGSGSPALSINLNNQGSRPCPN